MAELSSAERINLSLKMVFGIQGLSNTDDASGNKWYEEQYSWAPFLLNKQIYMSDVPTCVNIAGADANVTANPSIIERRDIKLTVVNGTNDRAWAAFKTYNDANSGIWDDWLLPQIFGKGYQLRLFQDNGSGTGVGSEITLSEGAWVPSYKLGFIVLASGYTAADIGWSQPLWARVYRYKGFKGISGSTASVALDDAYNNGSTIAVDNGAVVLNASNGYAPLQLTPLATVPTAGIAAGQICNVGGIAYIYDGSRLKWLSMMRENVSFHANRADGNYLGFGETSDNASGFVCSRPCTLTSVSASVGRGNMSKGFFVTKNGLEGQLYYFNLSSGKFFDSSASTVNVDFVQGDIVQVICDSIGGASSSAMVNLELAWKL